MPNLSLGTIEVFGLPAAVEAADVALKTANVQLIGYETTDGMGMVAVKIEGQVSAVLAAVAAASAAAARVSKVFATSVIARPSEQLGPVVLTDGTVGLAKPKAAPAPKLPEPVTASPTSDATPPEPQVEVVETLPDDVETPQPPVETPQPMVEPPQPLVEPVETPQPLVEPSAAKPRAARARTRSPRTATSRTTKK